MSGGEAGASDLTSVATTIAAEKINVAVAAETVLAGCIAADAVVRSFTRRSAGFRMTSDINY